MSAVIVVVAILIALLRGGKVGRLFNLHFERIELIFIALFLQYAVSLSAALGLPVITRYGNAVLGASYLLLLLGIWFNRKLPAARMIAVGVLLNALVILANGGRMPVSAAALSQAGLDYYIPLLEKGNYLKHAMLDAGTYFPFLADIIPLKPSVYPGGKVISVGDIILNLGVFLLVQITMCRRTTRRRRTAKVE
ncbi:MAG: DUF5317 domain-containing protein [bacterium]|jgi:hypothetical protein